MNITTALVIADPWIGMILDGSKTWEMRSTNTSRRGWIGLIRKGTGCVWGIAQIADSGLPMSPEKMIETFEKHRIPEHMIRSGEVSKWNTPWILKDVRVLNQPVPYTHKLGAVTWVSLDSEVSQAITQQLTLSHTVDHVQSLQRPSGNKLVDKPLSSAPKPIVSERPVYSPPSSMGQGNLIGETELTEGNIKHSHIYLRSFIHKFPGDTIGGSNIMKMAAKKVSVDWGGSSLIETDLDGEKKFFRSRSWIRMFFERYGAEPGDRVQVIEVRPYHYRLQINKA
jgi:hypothetical protein